MRKIFAGIAAGAIMFLSACGSVSSGEVVEKVYDEPYTTQEEIMTEECEWDRDTKIVNGKSKTTSEYECEEVGTGDYEDVEHPAKFSLVLENEDGDTGTVEVDQETYESVEVGEFYDSEQ